MIRRRKGGLLGQVLVSGANLNVRLTNLANGAGIEALDTAGAWALQKLLLRLRDEGMVVNVRGLRPEFAALLQVIGRQVADQATAPFAVAAAPASTPDPPLKPLLIAFPVSVSFPEPPTAFSMTAPSAIAMFEREFPTDENAP